DLPQGLRISEVHTINNTTSLGVLFANESAVPKEAKQAVYQVIPILNGNVLDDLGQDITLVKISKDNPDNSYSRLSLHYDRLYNDNQDKMHATYVMHNYLDHPILGAASKLRFVIERSG